MLRHVKLQIQTPHLVLAKRLQLKYPPSLVL